MAVTCETLAGAQRETFRQVCGLFLPAWKDMPDAAALGLENAQLDQALRARPHLLPALADILHTLGACAGASQAGVSHVGPDDLEKLKTGSLSDFLLLRTLVCGAYYLHPKAKAALGYPGQQALSLPRGGFGGEDLVMKMMEQPKRYRNPG